MTYSSRSAEGGQPNRRAPAAPALPAPGPSAGRAESEGREPRACTHTHSRSRGAHGLVPAHQTITPYGHAEDTQACWHTLESRLPHAPQTHTRYRQFCTHTHACTYSKSINRHTHTPQKFAVTQPHAHTASHRDGTQERPTGHSVHSLDDAILRDRWCIASFRCWGQHRGQNRPSPALRELTF